MSSNDLHMIYGVKTVTAAGAPEQLATGRPEDTLVRSVQIRALTGNGGDVYVGNVDVDAATPANCYILAPGETKVLRVNAEEWKAGMLINLSQIWLDVDNNGEGVCYEAVRD